jgi:hypothetical protein
MRVTADICQEHKSLGSRHGVRKTAQARYTTRGKIAVTKTTIERTHRNIKALHTMEGFLARIQVD